MITVNTPRKHFVKLTNGDITVFHKTGLTWSSVQVPNVYCEFDKKALEAKYGIGTLYRGLVIIDGQAPYVSSENASIPSGYFTIAPGDKVVNYLTTDVLQSGMRTYSVLDVAEYVRDGLLSVEVVLG